MLFFKIKIYQAKEFIKVVKRYYSNIKFLFFDLFFNFIYLFINPYRVSKNYLKKRSFKNIHVYGETPITTFEKIIKNAQVTNGSYVLELGAGRGKISFWLSFFKKSKILAVERIEVFVKIANFMAKIFRRNNLTFLSKDMLDLEFNKFTHVYLYGTCLSDKEINFLIKKFYNLPFSAKIITISYPLSEYDKNFKVIKSFDVSMPYGTTKAYINIRGNQ